MLSQTNLTSRRCNAGNILAIDGMPWNHATKQSGNTAEQVSG